MNGRAFKVEAMVQMCLCLKARGLLRELRGLICRHALTIDDLCWVPELIEEDDDSRYDDDPIVVKPPLGWVWGHIEGTARTYHTRCMTRNWFDDRRRQLIYEGVLRGSASPVNYGGYPPLTPFAQIK